MFSSKNRPSVAGSLWFPKSFAQESLKALMRELIKHASEEILIDFHLRSGGDDGSHIIAFRKTLEEQSKAVQDEEVQSLLKSVREFFPDEAKKFQWTIATVIDFQ